MRQGANNNCNYIEEEIEVLNYRWTTEKSIQCIKENEAKDRRGNHTPKVIIEKRSTTTHKTNHCINNN
jgi:hypothetical protein